jgi:hypothetical protein
LETERRGWGFAERLMGQLVPNDGCLNFVDENDEVLLAGFGRKGKAKGDIPGYALSDAIELSRY